MALQTSFSLKGTTFVREGDVLYETGFNTVNIGPLYARVESISGTKQEITGVVSFNQIQSQKTVASKKYTFFYELEGPNPIKQAYLHLKTLPEFADAIDC